MAIPIALVVLLIVARPVRWRVYAIPTSSWPPALHPGDRVMADLAAAEYERGSLVLFRLPEGPTYVKRLVALGGDKIRGGPDGITVNGRAVVRARVPPFAVTVPPGHAFMLGDNVANSRDRRTFGPVPIATIIGRPLYVLWGKSWNRTLTKIA